MRAVRVLSVVHGPLVGPALFGDVIREEGHELIEWQIAAGGEAAGADAVLVLGGDMNVGEEDMHPWLEQEYGLLRGWVASETPLLAICLGAQTLAHAFGARVAPAPERRAGFLDVSLTVEGGRDPVLGVLPEHFSALFANAYSFDLPAGAVELVSADSRAQAYRLGACAWALQFHPEARLSQVLAWWEQERDLPRPFAALRGELVAGIEAWSALGAALCRAFLAAAASLNRPGATRNRARRGARGPDGVAPGARARAQDGAGPSRGRSLRDHSCQEPP